MQLEDQRLLAQVMLRHTGIDLSNYKSGQVLRRLDGFMSKFGVGSVRAFASLLDHDAAVVTELRSFFTINVTEFFRDAEQFTTLRSTVLPDLLRQSTSLRIWSAGCSTGAEPYSVAILLEELNPGGRHYILATDLSANALSKAVAGGPYESDKIRNLHPGTMHKWFQQKSDGLWVAESLRKKVTFRRHDLLHDRFERDFDLLLCRNVVIYFTDEAKQLLYQRFYQALKDTGILFIGATESLLGERESGWKRTTGNFYRKAPVREPVADAAKRPGAAGARLR